jgi:hypothetical protein
MTSFRAYQQPSPMTAAERRRDRQLLNDRRAVYESYLFKASARATFSATADCTVADVLAMGVRFASKLQEARA